LVRFAVERELAHCKRALLGLTQRHASRNGFAETTARRSNCAAVRPSHPTRTPGRGAAA
jgi:hypothetical protein